VGRNDECSLEMKESEVIELVFIAHVTQELTRH